MRVLLATSEAVPYAKTGGLADVAGALYREIGRTDVDMRMVMPLYESVRAHANLVDTGMALSANVGGRTFDARVFSHDGRVYFIDCPELYGRPELYGTRHGEYADNAVRFVFLSRAVLELCLALPPDERPEVLHVNDWQTALVPLYLKTAYADRLRGIATVLTIHNLGYQGIFPASAMSLTGLPSGMLNPDLLEFYGQMNFLKAGIVSADAINTVSETYAREILNPAFGFGLEGVLAGRSAHLSGILNGLDYETWDPGSDAHLPANFGPRRMPGKATCKEALAARAGFTDPDRPVLGVVSRLVSQKGIELLAEAIAHFMPLELNLAIVGTGEKHFEDKLEALASEYKGRVFLFKGYNEELGRLVYAGADFFAIPSRYEPCGLTQMIAMRYGAVPLGRATGGLADTIEDYDPVRDEGTGFLFADYTPMAFVESMKRALCVYANPARWKRLQQRCMARDFTWGTSAARYTSLYRETHSRVVGL